jgi:DNA-binding PadR family transcriptional regulator
MSDRLNLTYTSGLILQTVAQGLSYGFDIIDHTGLPSGTVYPALRRLEGAGLVASLWDRNETEKSGGPPRKYYKLTPSGQDRLRLLYGRFPLLERTAR